MSERLKDDIKSGDAPDRVFSKPEVVNILRSVMDNLMQDDRSVMHLYEQLDAIAKHIESARAEIAALNPGEINEKHIASASDELDAVVEATAEATGIIMDCCEEMEKISEKACGDVQAKITDQVTRVYEACSFQDITGQRISKVVHALKHIEEKVDDLLILMGKGKSDGVKKEKAVSSNDEASLLNGPSTPAQGGVDQDEIDRLLAEFD
tara:strand:- start:175 stop:801 length:627 start_codon:yes stop_codon:yes gene_type:complete